MKIRRVIFEKFNDPNLRFTNDEVFEMLRADGLESSLTIDDMEPHFKQLREEGLIRPIAQNFTTQWFKIFDTVKRYSCKSCGQEVYLGRLEPRVCPNPQCKAAL
ncbi:MAG: hypothetical protein KGI33_05445 [Thaumarchaeota archaeon]|nr:hypothetical protein [Nitrososphaerota archaeon]